MINNILNFTGKTSEKSGFGRDSTFLTGKDNIVSLTDEKGWRELSKQLVQDEADGIAEIVTQIFQKRKEGINPESAEIISFEKIA